MPKPRVRHTCTECSQRRQQCDRRTPCGRCVKRGIPDQCRLNWEGQYDPTKHRVYPSKSRQLRQEQIPRPSVSTLNTTTGAGTSDGGDKSPTSGLLPRLADNRSGENPCVEQTWRYARPTASRPRYAFTPHVKARLRCGEELNGNSLWSFETTGRAHRHIEDLLQTLMPSVETLWKLVDYHEQYLLWYHCCCHGPTFRSELESVIDEQEENVTLVVANLRLQWLALLFSIMTASLTCTTESRLREWGFSKPETKSLSMQWYRATVACLTHGTWTANHEQYSVQAVTTLTLSAHALGQSNELSVLLGTAVKVAQSLGLDRLVYDPILEFVDESSSSEQRHRALQRDLGRKLWSQLCIQDWTAIPFTRSYIINSAHFTTTRASSRDYLTMEFVPSTFPTYISYTNYLLDIAQLVAKHFEATLQSKTPFTKYQHVLDYDKQMRTLATKGMPRYFHVIEPVHEQWPEWVHWARSSLTVCFSHKIIMIHRDYIAESFTNTAYSTTRMTCVAAAKTILNEANKAKHMNGPVIWVDQAFCVAAALILCLDILHRPEADHLHHTQQVLVLEFLEQLQSFDNSVISLRGAKLLQEALQHNEQRAPISAGGTTELQTMAEDEAASIEATLLSPLRQNFAEQVFPPAAGFSNAFLRDNLLNKILAKEWT